MTEVNRKSFPSRVRYILWDWNGTLLNDVILCLDTINSMLGRRKLKTLSIDQYKNIFNFPVREYYKEAGFCFEKEPFDVLAVEFIEAYYRGFNNAELHPYAKEILDNIHKAGLQQGILSATEHQTLKDNLRQHQLDVYFDQLSGIHNHHADGKLYAGQKILEQIDAEPQEILMIGDTLHDAEVAEALGLSFCFVSHGHHAHSRLEPLGYKVFKDLEQLWKTLILNLAK